MLADKTLYSCTFSLLHHHLVRFGVATRFVDMTDPASVAAAMGPKTRLVVTETPSNPNMRVVDIAAIAEITHRHDAPPTASPTA